MNYSISAIVISGAGILVSLIGLSKLGEIGLVLGIPFLLSAWILTRFKQVQAELNIRDRKIERLKSQIYLLSEKIGVSIGVCSNCGGQEPTGDCNYCHEEICPLCRSDHHMNYCRRSPHFVDLS
ncbi:MAG: hypothetical protein ACXAE3_02880 [Candidatus Kariarchaeaceae archaeon]